MCSGFFRVFSVFCFFFSYIGFQRCCVVVCDTQVSWNVQHASLELPSLGSQSQFSDSQFPCSIVCACNCGVFPLLMCLLLSSNTLWGGVALSCASLCHPLIQARMAPGGQAFIEFADQMQASETFSRRHSAFGVGGQVLLIVR